MINCTYLMECLMELLMAITTRKRSGKGRMVLKSQQWDLVKRKNQTSIVIDEIDLALDYGMKFCLLGSMLASKADDNPQVQCLQKSEIIPCDGWKMSWRQLMGCISFGNGTVTFKYKVNVLVNFVV